MRIWIDDARPMPSWFDTHAHNYEEAISLIKQNHMEFISFDHDLGEGKSGYDVACFLEALYIQGKILTLSYSIHSANPVGRQRIESALTNSFGKPHKSCFDYAKKTDKI